MKSSLLGWIFCYFVPGRSVSAMRPFCGMDAKTSFPAAPSIFRISAFDYETTTFLIGSDTAGASQNKNDAFTINISLVH